MRIYPALGDLFLRDAVNVTVFGYLPVVPMVLGSALLMILVSLLTRPPSQATIDRYFTSRRETAFDSAVTIQPGEADAVSREGSTVLKMEEGGSTG